MIPSIKQSNGSPIVIRLEGGETCDEFIVADHRVLVLVQSLVEQTHAFLTWVHICLLEEVSQVLKCHVALLLLVDEVEGHVQLNGTFVDDSLADELDRHFALDETSDELLQQVSRLPLEILARIAFSPVKAASRVDKHGILVLSGHEAVTNLTVAQDTIAVLVQLVEDNKYFIFRDGQLEIIHECSVQIIAIDTTFACIKLGKHFVSVAHVEVCSKCQFSPLLLQLALNLAHVTHCLCEIPGPHEQARLELGCRWEEHTLPVCCMLDVH